MLSFTKQDGSEELPENLTLAQIVEPIKLILQKRFPGDLERQHIVSRLNGRRLNFCCPYCGDSHESARKKRGNFYSEWLYFKCYNGGCEEYVDLLKMIEDFKVDSMLSDNEKTDVKLRIKASRETARKQQILRNELSYEALTNTDFTKILVPRQALMKKLGLMEIHQKSPMGVYLTKRCQLADERFAWDPKKKRLFIFNLDPKSEWVFALQTRQFNGYTKAKYLTYNLSGIWSKMMFNEDEEFLEKAREIDHISTIFNVLRINFNYNITLFEGPLDSFLYPNSVGLCSINNDFPFDVENYRYLQDNDNAGRSKAMEIINGGNQVFLWRSFIQDFELHGKKLKDYNDLIIYQRANGVDFGNLDKYFSTHKYDAINI